MRTFTLVGCALAVIIAVLSMFHSGFTGWAIGVLIFFGGGGISILYEDKLDAVVRRRAPVDCVVDDDHIYFPKGYYFRYGYLAGRKRLEYGVIDEIRLGTFMITAKINGNELIFLRGAKQEDIVRFAARYSIPAGKHQDNWSLICDEYLDTEIDALDRGRITRLLLQAGISLSEQRQIKKRVAFAMLVRTYFTLEWVYYGQYDVLLSIYLTERKYWWTMDIALREGDEKNSISTQGSAKK